MKRHAPYLLMIILCTVQVGLNEMMAVGKRCPASDFALNEILGNLKYTGVFATELYEIRRAFVAHT